MKNQAISDDKGLFTRYQTPARNQMDVEAKNILERAIQTSVLAKATEGITGRPLNYIPQGVFSTVSVNQFKDLLCETASDGRCADPLDFLENLKLDISQKLTFLETVARELGNDWTRDTHNFLEVTIAMGRLQWVLRKLCQVEAQSVGWQRRGSVLIAVAPGEEHTFAQCLLEELFRARGWETTLLYPNTPDELRAAVDSAQYDILCFSWASEFLSDTVADCIRLASTTPLAKRPVVVSGGHAAEKRGPWLADIGVDRVCENAYSALIIAENELARRPQAAAVMAI